MTLALECLPVGLGAMIADERASASALRQPAAILAASNDALRIVARGMKEDGPDEPSGLTVGS